MEPAGEPAESEVREMQTIAVDRPRSRRVLGAMNDFNGSAEIVLRECPGRFAWF